MAPIADTPAKKTKAAAKPSAKKQPAAKSKSVAKSSPTAKAKVAQRSGPNAYIIIKHTRDHNKFSAM